MLEKAQKFMDSNNCLSLLKFPIPSNQTPNISLSEFKAVIRWPIRVCFRMDF